MMIKKSKLILTIICISLFVSTIIITYYSYARYRNMSSSNSSNIIANWEVSATSNNNSVDVVAGSLTDTYELTVNNESDVEVKYSIQLSNLPNDIQVKLDDGEYQTPVDNNITFTNAGQLDYNETTSRNHILTFSSSINTNEVVNQNIEIGVVFEQL